MECECECGMELNGDDITLDTGAEMDFQNLDVMMVHPLDLSSR